jgi:hypothetical protein
MAPRKRRCRRHYGIRLRMPFREGIDPEDRAQYDEYSGQKMCKNRMVWCFGKVRMTSALHSTTEKSLQD